MILTGSRAVLHWYPDAKRKPKDYDWIVGDIDKKGIKRIAEEIHEYHANPIIYDLYKDSTDKIISPDHLLTLKMSHMFWDIFWEKHLYDIILLTDRGHRCIPDLFYKLYEYWIGIHGSNPRSDLTLNAKDFFDNALKKYDHDHLHTLINPSPTYLKVLKDGSEVEPDENKFNNLSHQEKLDLVREEVYVMAYERIGKMGYVEAYTKMLKKFVMNHAPLWEAIFILQNYRELGKPFINYKKQIDYELARID